jgi:hypothetical protein
VATSPSIGAGRSALRHPGRDRSLGCAHANRAHAGTVAQRPRYAPPQSDFAVVIEIIDYADLPIMDQSDFKFGINLRFREDPFRQ